LRRFATVAPLYALACFLAVIVSPILVIAAGINAVLARLTRRK
jgi:hypothetical protein